MVVIGWIHMANDRTYNLHNFKEKEKCGSVETEELENIIGFKSWPFPLYFGKI